MKILVFGAGGQVGHEVGRAAWPASYDLSPLDRSAGDITKPAAVSALIARQRPDLVINLAHIPREAAVGQGQAPAALC